MASTRLTVPKLQDFPSKQLDQTDECIERLEPKRNVHDQRSDETYASAAKNDNTPSFKSASTATASTRPAEPIFLGIPAELRNKIYEYVIPITVTWDYSNSTRKLVKIKSRFVEKYTILGWKFTKAHAAAKSDKSPLRQQFKSAAVSHPLSQICRQTHYEFPIHETSFTATTYDLVISNFDVEQIELFLRIIEEEKISLERVCLRFQIDRNILHSLQDLHDLVKALDPFSEPRCLKQYSRVDSQHMVLLNYRNALGYLDLNKCAHEWQLREACNAILALKGSISCTPLKQWLLRFLCIAKHGSFNDFAQTSPRRSLSRKA